MAEFVILVDEMDRPVGLEEKTRCHLPDGRLHRAFTALLFDHNGRLMLARRSPDKMLWPGDWDGTFASHPRDGETYISSAQRRMPEEIGPRCNMDYLFKFEYHVPYGDVGSENEICGTLIGVTDGEGLDPDDGEVSEIGWVTPEMLAADLKEAPRSYCPWMLVALYFLDTSSPAMLEKYGNTLREWIRPETKRQIKESIGEHMSESQWRLLKDE